MTGDKERICEVYWEGPFEYEAHYARGFENTEATKEGVIYIMTGRHPAGGVDRLLYIGITVRAEQTLAARPEEHRNWILDEADQIQVFIGTVGDLGRWSERERREGRLEPTFPEPIRDRAVVEGLESLLIYARQPDYNASKKSGVPEKAGHLRVFNTGRRGPLLPEVSGRYYTDWMPADE